MAVFMHSQLRMFGAAVSRLMAGARGRVLADAASRVWNGALSFVILPAYLYFIGAESFGVVSLYAAAQAVIALLDCSLAPSLTRQLARSRVTKESWNRSHDLAKTMEVIYWGFAILAGVCFSLLVPIISSYWLNPTQLSAAEVKAALYIGAIGLAVQWPSTLYSGGLVGLQKQNTLAILNVFGSTLRAMLTVFCLWAISSSVEVLFWVGAALGLIHTLVMRYVFWQSMPNRETRGIFRMTLLAEIWRFAFGVSAITITSVILLQADKITLSRLLPLEEFGYYAISTALANALFIATGSIFSVTFPKLSELAVSGDREKLITFYHLACQGVALAILPISAVISIFSSELLQLWTRNPHIAENGHSILSVFVVGNIFNCLLSVPYTVQLAFGLTRVAIVANFVALLLAFPLTYFLYGTYGSLSGPIMWMIINFGLLVTLTFVSHYRVLSGEAMKWCIVDTGLPLLVSFAIVAIFRQILPVLVGGWQIAIAIFVGWVLATACTYAVLPDLRIKLAAVVRHN